MFLNKKGNRKQYIRTNLIIIVLLSLLWIVLAWIVNPQGEFPLNDDWAYYKNLLTFTGSCQMTFANWSAMTLVAQLWFGSWVVHWFDFSFTALRILTLTMGLTGILFSYALLSKITPSRRMSVFLTLLILANPIFFNLSFTFMTDIYFFTFSVISSYYFIRYIKINHIWNLAAATVFVIMAILVRQTGLFLGLSYTLVLVFQKGSAKRVFVNLIPALTSLLTMVLYNYWFRINNGDVGTYYTMNTAFSQLGFKTLENLFYRIGTTGLSLGLFLLPFLLAILPDTFRKITDPKNRIAVFLTLLCLIPLMRGWTLFPMGNIFYDLGTGPKLLKDAYILKTNSYPVMGSAGLFLLRLAALSGGLMVYFRFFIFILTIKSTITSHKPHDIIRRWAFVLVILYFVSFIIPDFYFDRYLISLLVPLMILLSPESIYRPHRVYERVSWVLAGVFLLFSVLSTHDYLEWNRARWKGIAYLMNEKNVEARRIDGGFEFNGWYETGEYKENTEKSWWFIDRDDFLITFGPLPGKKVMQMIPYRTYFPPDIKYIYILQNPSASVETSE